MSSRFEYDVFLSHSSKDGARVSRLAERLRSKGFRVWLYQWVIQPGDDIFLAIERGLEASRVLVLCMSTNAFAADWVDLERSTVLFRDPSNIGRRFIPILLDDCAIPTTIRRLCHIDFRGETEGAFQALVAACRRQEGGALSDQEAVVEQGILNAPPSPNPFYGRKNDLQRIRDFLDANSKAERHVVGIEGKIGVGKSTFLAHLAWEDFIRTRFREGVYWAALGQSQIAESVMLREWCRLARVDSAGLLPREMAARLGQEFLGKRILLLVDDVWQASDLGLVQRLLHPTVHLIFSSRLPRVAREVSPGRTWPLAPLDEAAGLDLLRYFAREAVDAHLEKCRELVRALEGVPLALQVAGPLLASHHRLGLGVDAFIESLGQGAVLLAEAPPPGMGPFLEEANKNTTVAELYKRSVDFLPQDARKGFFCLGAMSPKPATFDLAALRDLWFFLPDPLPALTVLADSGLLEPLSNGRFQMHAMLVAYAKWRLKGARTLDDL